MIQFPILRKHLSRLRESQFAINIYAGVVDLFIHADLRVDGDAFNNGFKGEVDGGAASDEGCGAGGEDEGKHCGGLFLTVRDYSGVVCGKIKIRYLIQTSLRY